MRRFVMILLLCVIGITTARFALAEENAAEILEPTYYPLLPKIVTNLQSPPAKQVFVQVRVEFMARGVKNIETLEYYDTPLRDIAITSITERSQKDLVTQSGRKKLSEEMLQLTQSFFEKEEGRPVVERVLFTDVVVE